MAEPGDERATELNLFMEITEVYWPVARWRGYRKAPEPGIDAGITQNIKGLSLR